MFVLKNTNGLYHVGFLDRRTRYSPVWNTDITQASTWATREEAEAVAAYWTKSSMFLGGQSCAGCVVEETT